MRFISSHFRSEAEFTAGYVALLPGGVTTHYSLDNLADASNFS
jgi:hypothetical protein